MTRPLRARIDRAALRHNLAVVRRASPNSAVMAIVKADGYGHGIDRVVSTLSGRVEAFGVTTLEEALAVRSVSASSPVVLLEGIFSPDELAEVDRQALDIVVHSSEQVEILEGAPMRCPVTVWLKVDTGMHRLGFHPSAVPSAWRRLADCAGVASDIRLMTHLARADDPSDSFTALQLERFRAGCSGLSGPRSAANSAAVLGRPDSHGDWVRPGIMLYGGSPFGGVSATSLGLRPVMTLESRLIAVQRCPRGETLGYGGAWTCPEDMAVGVVAAGYGDGYPRHVPAGTSVLLNGAVAPVIGRISMDMLTVDLRTQPKARAGDRVVLWGDGLPVDEVAQAAGTIAYELLCGVAGRVPRIDAGGVTHGDHSDQE